MPVYLAIFSVDFQYRIRPHYVQIVVLGILFPLRVSHEVHTITLKRHWYPVVRNSNYSNDFSVYKIINGKKQVYTRGLLSLRGRVRGLLVFEHLAGLQFFFQNCSFFRRATVSELLALLRKNIDME